MTYSKCQVFDESRQHPASFTLTEEREGAQEYRFAGLLSDALTQTLSLTGPVIFSLAARDQPVVVDFTFPSEDIMRFVVYPGMPLVCEPPVDADDIYPESVTIVPLASPSNIDLLMYTDTPALPEEFIWLRSGYGVETVQVGTEDRVLTWRDTRENALAKSYWSWPNGTPVVYDRDDELNGQFSLDFPAVFGCVGVYNGTDLDDLPVGDYTIMVVAMPEDDDSATTTYFRTMVATEDGRSVPGPVAGVSLLVDGGYRTGVHYRNPGEVDELTGFWLCDQENAPKPTVFILEVISSEERYTIYRQGEEESFGWDPLNEVTGLKKFTIGGTYDFGEGTWNGNNLKGRIVDIRVHNRLLTATEKAQYSSYAARTYGVDDTPSPVFPWTTEATFYARSSRGYSPVSAILPNDLGSWKDTRLGKAAAFESQGIGAVTKVDSSSSFDGYRAFLWDGASALIFAGSSSYYNLLGGSADYTIGMVLRSDMSAPGDLTADDGGATLFSSRISGATGGTYWCWPADGYEADDLHAQVTGADGTTLRYDGNLTLGPGVPCMAVVAFDTATSGTFLLQGESQIEAATAGYLAFSAAPLLGADTLSDSVQRTRFSGEIVEIWWLPRLATDEELAAYREYVTYRYGIADP